MASGPAANDLETILTSGALGRLRGIKQLGFASHAFPMADHSRFTHALGSMHIAGLLAAKVIGEGVPESQLRAVIAEFPRLGSPKGAKQSLIAHTQAAAALQDTGELPYENALRGIYRPDDDLRKLVASWTGTDTTASFTDKEVFTLAFIRDLDRRKALADLDAELISLLVCRKIYHAMSSNKIIRQLRNILDSPLDADRIDYVYRDALLTIGAIGNPGLVVDAIKTYEIDHVVVTNPAHIGALLMARNYLYRSVYLDPVRRLREQALRHVFNHVLTGSADPKPWQITPQPGEITIDSFLQLDDSAIASAIRQMAESPEAIRTLPEETKRALGTLQDESNSRYESVWVSPVDPVDYDERRRVPQGIVADPRDDYIRVGASDLSFIRVAGEHFYGSDDQTIDAWIPEVAAADEMATPASILAFVPLDMDLRTRNQYERAWNDGTLYISLKRQLMERELSYPADTRKLPGFSGAAIHILFCWGNLESVKRIVRGLHELRRPYYILLDAFEGLGSPTRANSATLVRTAPRLLILASERYLDRLHGDPMGNIAAELTMCHELSVQGKLPPTVVLAIDDWKKVADGFPWSHIGEREPPYFGSKEVEECDASELKDLVKAVADNLA